MRWPSTDHLASPKPTKCFLLLQPRGCIVVLPGRTFACHATLFPSYPHSETPSFNLAFVSGH